MILTMRQYMLNPQGKGSSASYANLWKKDYDPRYDALMAHHGDLETIVYKAPNDVYFIHVKVPSESFDEVEYDVVLKVEKKGTVPDTSYKDWPVRAISNSPSFVYTYENVFRRNKILVEELRKLLPDESYNEPPKIRNPYKAVGYEKSVYFAIKYLLTKYPTVNNLNAISEKYSFKTLKEEFMVHDKLMGRLKLEQKKRTEEKKKKRVEEKKKHKKLFNNNLFTIKQDIAGKSNVVSRSSNRVKALNSVSKSKQRAKTARKI